MLESVLRRVLACGLLLAPPALWACTRSAVSNDEPAGPICEEAFSGWGGVSLGGVPAVDILFVIDNSGSMAEHQVKLNAGAAALFEGLDAGNIDYRIGFTTSDNGNPWCPAGLTTPEGGKLVLSSCKDRLDDFVFNGGEVDARDLACNQQCSLDAAALAITPTTTAVDDVPVARPWLQRVGGVGNLPAGTDPVAAFQCFAPQGINGCGFESQLESMYLSLVRATTSGEASHGFVRSSAILAVVILSDEADCSYDKNWASIFEADGDKAFWQDPNQPFPSSALCWNAGVACVGDPSGYDGCEPADKDVLANLTSDPGAAVLHPLDRYLGLLEGLEQDKQDLDPNQEILFTLIAGVEGGGEGWSVSYADAVDPEVQLAYGIGPGCVGADGLSGVPPVRMRALAEALDPLGLYSVCAPDHGAALASLGDRIAAKVQGSSCYPGCVADGDRSTPRLEPNCKVRLDPPGGPRVDLDPCARGADGAYLVDAETGRYQTPAGVDLCYVMLVDRDGDQTLDAHDDLSPTCVEAGANLEFVLVRRPGFAEPDGSQVSADCLRTECVDEHCPWLGG